jgi:hypothetical protein
MSTATELLSRALDALVEEAQYHNDIMLRWHDVFLDIRTFLATETEAEPVGEIDGLARACNLAGVDYKDFLRIKAYMPIPPRPEPEAEPVAWIQPNHLDKAQFMPFLCRVEPKQRDDFIPLYTRPEPARKPMTREEIKGEARLLGGCLGHAPSAFDEGFELGVRVAEKHHGITE